MRRISKWISVGFRLDFLKFRFDFLLISIRFDFHSMLILTSIWFRCDLARFRFDFGWIRLDFDLILIGFRMDSGLMQSSTSSRSSPGGARKS